MSFKYAGAVLSKDKINWIVPVCPFCGKTHYHGSGGINADHKKFLGGRVPHCYPDRTKDEYRLKAIPKKYLK